jgi:microcystin-dependent protein
LECNGAAVSRTTFADLFAAIGTTFGVGDGATTFNVPDMRGRVPVGDGTGAAQFSGVDVDVDTGTDEIIVPSNTRKWITGMEVTYNLTSGSITGLVDTTNYFVIRVSATRIQLASTLANAQNGTNIGFSAKSNPVFDLDHVVEARTLGEQGGEYEHAQSSDELLSHNHTGGYNTSAGGLQAGAQMFGGTSSSIATSTVGGNNAANNMPPFLVTKYIIST